MSEEEMLIRLVFKDESGRDMRPEEIQLLLSHISEILIAIQEAEEKDVG